MPVGGKEPRRDAGGRSAFALLLFAVLAGAMAVGWWIAPRLDRGARGGEEAEPSETPRQERLSFDELARLLESRRSSPIASEFARDFMSRPKLKKIFNEFRERDAHSKARHQEGPTAEEFVRELRRQKEFAELFGRWAGRPGFRSLAEGLASSPRVADALREAKAGGGKPGEDPAAPGTIAPGQRVFGIFTSDGSEAGSLPLSVDQTAVDDFRRSAARRGPGDPRPEGHWVDDPRDTSFLGVCRRMGQLQQCLDALEQCKGDANCANMVRSSPLFRGGGGAPGGPAASSGPWQNPGGVPPKGESMRSEKGL